MIFWLASPRRTENGERVTGLHAAVEIRRTVGFFSGSGTPPLTSRTGSNAKGELRFSNEANWRDWIDAELAAHATKNQVAKKDISGFKAFRWKLDGYWPETNSRVEMYSTGKPALWRNNESISLAFPSLQKVRVIIKSQADSKPLANVHLQFRIEQNPRRQDRLWDEVNACAWSDATGVAVVWLPKGEYRVLWDPTTAINGCSTPSELFSIEDKRFGELSRLRDSRNALVDEARREAMRPQYFFFNDDQVPLRVNEVMPEVYELKIEAPLTIVP